MFNKLMQPGESAEFPASGSHVRIDQGAKVFIKTDQNETVNLNERETGIFRPFNGVTITNLSASAETVEIRVSTARIIAADDGATVAVSNDVGIDDATPLRVEVITQPVLSVSATVNASNTIQCPADVALTAATATVIAAVNTARKELMIKNPSSNTASIRIGSITVAANKGFELEPGESTILTTTAAVYGFSVPGESISVTELEFV